MIKKTVLTVLAAIGLVTYTQGQGYVDFNNYAITNGVLTGAPIYDATNAPFNGVAVGSVAGGSDVTNFFAQLYAAAGTGVSSDSLVPVGYPVNFDIPGFVQFSGDTTTLGQLVDESVLVPTNSVGVTVQIRAWRGNGTQVTSYEQARVTHGPTSRFGVSPTLSITQDKIGDQSDVLATELDNLQSFNLQVPAPCPTITVSPALLGDGLTNVAYTSATITGSGGAAPYTFSVTSGSLPAGLSLNTNTGVITGTPSAVGLSSFTITATDFNGCTATHNYAVRINAACVGGTPAKPNIVYPKSNGTENTNGVVLITGNVKATAGHVLDQILVSLNGGVAQNGTVAGTNWSYSATLTPGTNSVSVIAVDTCGNISLSSVTNNFQWAVTNLLTIHLVGSGSGAVVGKKSGGVFTPAPAGLPLLNIGQSYSLGFSPNANNIFSNAVLALGTNVLATVNNVGLPNLTFTMQSNLTLTVAFETNAFLLAKGTYYGLFYEDPTNVQVASAGYIRVDTAATPAGGTFSAQLYVQGAKVKCAGSFDLSGHAVVTTFGGPGAVLMASGSTMTLDLDLPGTVAGTDLTLTGTIVNTNNWTSELMADKQYWKKIVNPCPLTSKYTLILPGNTNAGPAGDSYATVVCPTTGNGLPGISGKYADFTPLSPITTTPTVNPLGLLPAGASLSKELRYPFYTKIYSTAPTFGGIGIGWLQFSTTNISGNVIWIKPASVAGLYPNQPAGFTNEIAVLGEPYTAFPAGTYALTLAGGNLGSTINVPGNTFSGTSFTTIGANAVVLKLALTAGNGTFNNTAGASSFQFPGHTTPATKLWGAVLQNSHVVRGFFIGTAQTVSGSVLLQ